ncbi:MAG: peptidoglycan DD-metalloendopeptidase family protein [Anaerolineales bacterium]|jgi:murein DD-endopeptidase MepM/ murein hydrolase activator NlpD
MMTENASEPKSREPKRRIALREWVRRVGEFWENRKQSAGKATVTRYMGHAALLLVVVLGILAVRFGIDRLPEDTLAERWEVESRGGASSQSQPVKAEVDLPNFTGITEVSVGVHRQADLHTVIPTRPRIQIVKYVVQTGDTLFGIAEKFGLKPESVLWGNWYMLEGDPHSLRPGQELDIPPVNGVIHMWSAGEGLGGVAEFYGVAAQDVLDWPGNELDPELDPSNPQIEAGTLLVIPGGRRELPTWRAPRIYRTNPASASVLGPGHCGQVYDGPVGAGVFDWPTTSTWLSGYPYDPDVHPAIDIGGKTGYPIFASDAGVVVYAGWNNWGYGNVIVIDHGNGWQTLYAHLSKVNVGCGQAVYMGNVIGEMGSTGNSSGPHLHFEMMSDTYGKVNPLDFLP